MEKKNPVAAEASRLLPKGRAVELELPHKPSVDWHWIAAAAVEAVAPFGP